MSSNTPVYTVNIGGNNNESDLVIGSANAMINDAPDLTSIYLSIVNLENSLTLNNDNDLLQESSIANNVSGIANNASDLSTNASGISTNASGVSTNVSRLDVHESLITKTIKYIFHLPLGLKCLAENSHSMKTWLIAEHDGLENCFVYELYSDSNVSAVHSVKALKQGSNLLINFEHIKSHFYFSKEFSEELKSVLTNNTLVLTPLDPASPTPISEPMGYEHTGATFENGRYSPDTSTLNNFKILDKFYYTPPYNVAYNTTTQGNFILGYGSAFWSNYSPAKSVATLTYNNQMIFKHMPYWYHNENNLFGEEVDISGVNGENKTIEIKRRDLSLEYNVDIEYLDNSFYSVNQAYVKILVPEQDLKQPIVYDTKVRDKTGQITYYSEEWGGYTATKLKGVYVLSYSAISSTSDNAFYNDSTNNIDNRNVISTFAIQPYLNVYITEREGYYCKSAFQRNSWVNDDSNILYTMHDVLNSNNQYGMTKNSIQYPFGRSFNRTPSTIPIPLGVTNNNPTLNVRIVAFDNMLKDPRPGMDSNYIFNYIDLVNNWDQQHTTDQYNIFNTNPFFLGNGDIELDKLKTITKLTNPQKVLNLLGGISTNMNYYNGQSLNVYDAYSSPFQFEFNNLAQNYASDKLSNGYGYSPDTEMWSFRGQHVAMLTAGLIENALYGNMKYNETTKKLEPIKPNPDRVIGGSFDRTGLNIHKNQTYYQSSKVHGSNPNMWLSNFTASTISIGKIHDWIENNLADNEFMKNYPNFNNFKEEFVEYLNNNIDLYSPGYTSTNTKIIQGASIQPHGANYVPSDINLPRTMCQLPSSRYLDASANPNNDLIAELRSYIYNPSVSNINENFKGLAFINYRDREDFFDTNKGNKQPFIDWYSNKPGKTETLYNTSVTDMLNGGKLGHSVTTHIDVDVKNLLSGVLLGSVLNNTDPIIETVDQITENSHYKSLKGGYLRYYATKWKTNEEYYKDYQTTEWFEDTGSMPILGYASGMKHSYVYLYGPRASNYDANNEPLAEDFIVNGEPRKRYVQHDGDTVIMKSYPVVFDESSKKAQYDVSNAVASNYRVGIWTDNKVKWCVVPQETISKNGYTMKYLSEGFCAYGGAATFFDEVYSEAEILANTTLNSNNEKQYIETLRILKNLNYNSNNKYILWQASELTHELLILPKVSEFTNTDMWFFYVWQQTEQLYKTSSNLLNTDEAYSLDTGKLIPGLKTGKLLGYTDTSANVPTPIKDYVNQYSDGIELLNAMNGNEEIYYFEIIADPKFSGLTGNMTSRIDFFIIDTRTVQNPKGVVYRLTSTLDQPINFVNIVRNSLNSVTVDFDVNIVALTSQSNNGGNQNYIQNTKYYQSRYYRVSNNAPLLQYIDSSEFVNRSPVKQVIKTIRDSNNAIKYYYNPNNRFWRHAIDGVHNDNSKFHITDELKAYLKQVRPKMIFDNDENLDENTRRNYAMPTFTKQNSKYSGLYGFDVPNLGRNRGTSSGVSQVCFDQYGGEIEANYQVTASQFNNSYPTLQKNMIQYYIPNLKEKFSLPSNMTKGRYLTEQALELCFHGSCHFQNNNDLRQNLYGGKVGRILYRRDMVYNQEIFDNSDCLLQDDCTDNLLTGLTDKNVSFEGPEIALCCHLGKSALMEDEEKGIPKAPYSVKIQFNEDFTLMSIDYKNTGLSNLGVSDYNITDVSVNHSETNDLGVYFEKTNVIRGRFVACNNEYRPYILFSQLQFYNASTSTWNDEIPDYGEFLKSNEGSLPNSPYLTYKFNCLSLPTNEVLNVYRITANGIQYANFAFSDDAAKAKYAAASVGDLVERADHGFIVQNGFTASNFNIYDAPIYKITADGIQYANFAFSDDAAKAKYAAASPGDYVDQVDVEFIVQNGFTASNFNIYNAPIYAITADGIQYANYAFNDDAAKAKYAAASPGDFVDQADVEFIVQNGFTASNFKIY